MLKNVTATPPPKLCLSREEPFEAWNDVRCYMWIFTIDCFDMMSRPAKNGGQIFGYYSINSSSR